MLTKSSAALKVNSQKSQDKFVFGSEGLVTDGSTSAGPGLRRKVKVPSTENQIRLPARWGTVTVVVLPGAPTKLQFRCQYCPCEEEYRAMEHVSRVKTPEICLKTQVLLQQGKYGLRKYVRGMAQS